MPLAEIPNVYHFNSLHRAIVGAKFEEVPNVLQSIEECRQARLITEKQALALRTLRCCDTCGNLHGDNHCEHDYRNWVPRTDGGRERL